MKKYINIKYWILSWMFVLLGFVNVTFAQTADLITHQPSASLPSGVTFEWHNALPISVNNLVDTPIAVIPGLYYGVYNFGTCYSEAAPIRVATNSCPVATIDLNSFVENTVTPLGMTLTFHNDLPASDANKLSVTAITAAAAGIYYVAYKDDIVGCYSTESVIVVVNSSCLNVWTGTTSTDWNDATNWSAGVPLTDGDVIIPLVTNYPVLDQDRSIGNLSIATGATPDTGATLSLGSNTLTVKGAFTGDGTLIGSSTSGLTINGTGNQGIFYMNETLGNNKLANFTLNSTVSGSVTLGNAMDIYGVLTLTNGTFNTGGNITLKSNGLGTAVVAPILNCGNVAITGDVTVERFFPAGRAFRLITSPVTTTYTTNPTIRDNWQEGENNATTNYNTNLNRNPGYGTHITGNMTGAYGFDYTQTTANSMFTFNNTTRAWTAISNTNVLTLTAGDPYRLMIRGSRAIDMSNNNPQVVDDTTLRAKGVLKICDASAGVLSETSGVLNFIGNPYQAIVEIKKVLTNSTNLNSNFYQVWDPKVSTRGAYVAYTFDGNLSTNTSSDVNAYLQPWQACFVATTSSGASIMFHESDKKTDSQVIENVYRTNNLASYIRLTLYESNTLASNGAAADGLIVKFGENYVNAIDGYDALKLGNLDETFSTKNNTSLVGIESRLLPVASDVIPLNIAQYRFTNYTMVANGTNMSGLPAYLHDQLLQTYTEIPQSDSVNYPYVLDTTDPATSASDRFRIVFQNPFLNLESNAALVFTMSPNPSKQGVFDVVMNGATADTKLVIYNTIGQEVYATNLTQATINHINPNKVFANGVYYVKIKKDAATTIKKLIIR
ncbi:Secretion system C-terminal sorting domain [Flavobacteriaceae bacterium]